MRARRARVRRACWSGSRGLLAGRQVMRVTMATHQRKCILQETLIPSPRSWDSLTFHSHTVIRYQLSVQGGRLHGCSPAWGGGAGRRALKTQGRFPAVGQGGAPPPVASLQARVRSPGDPARAGPRPLHTHLLRARAPACPPSRSPSPSPASPLPAHLPCTRPPRPPPGTLPTCPLCGPVPFDLASSPSGSARYVPGAVPSLISVILTDPVW